MNKNYDYFLTIVKMGNLTRAADALYITQSSLSKYLSRLEADLNIQLFDRSSSPMVLTYAGHLYLEYVNRLLAMDSRLQAEFDEVRSETRGETTFGITSWRSSIMLPTLLPVLHDRYPHIRVNVSEGRSYTFESAMLNGQVDFCLVPYPAHFNMATTHEDMGREKLYLAGNRSHPAVQKALSGPRSADGMPRFDPQLLNGEYFISLKPGQVLSRVNRQFLTEHEITLAGMWNTENTVTSLILSIAHFASLAFRRCAYIRRAFPPTLCSWSWAIRRWTGEKPSSTLSRRGSRASCALSLIWSRNSTTTIRRCANSTGRRTSPNGAPVRKGKRPKSHRREPHRPSCRVRTARRRLSIL